MHAACSRILSGRLSSYFDAALGWHVGFAQSHSSTCGGVEACGAGFLANAGASLPAPSDNEGIRHSLCLAAAVFVYGLARRSGLRILHSSSELELNADAQIVN